MVHVITGAPCSGKSTYIEEHAKQGDLIIDFDKMAVAMGAESHNLTSHIKEATMRARDAVISVALANEKAESWIIDTNMKRDYPKSVEVVVLDPGKEVCLERAKRDGRPEWTIDVIEQWYANQKGRAMNYLYKSFNIIADDAGTISGYFSTYDREPDSYGDIVAKGAFTETIAKRKESGHPFPLCWNHDLDQIIGKVDSIEVKTGTLWPKLFTTV